uniref:6-pyruvoyltetrahydropterin synthase n=1 Tax=Entomoneis paludosa TaxID=265537 RepID=A0A7S2YGV4_9STRA|mmetsp:Transcript_32349/g.67479  ORF Transcript_32349/g.67479 Transcript_32349/m.67479 type:complete len:278 (+) Transcript_32349:57-890(+)|eukprot:CAMPEP_0172458792 /NCGR_PEP_ID=MMETSP1065-20121228/29349_1 /TAXON_ID=265537 /ORGANISM="Amphiprora paludosa, Strain CCMP125" /LENGTH=277 /DNA_ID=CAMNT_0013213205 /DNA_START=21 /DNA_END=854 /DNA_ORIENTATION=-
MTSPAAPSSPPKCAFEVQVAKEDFKFHAAHFVAFDGFREPLHGHNYRVGVRLLGNRKIGPDGYLIDFGDVKRVTKEVCKKLNNHFLCPMNSNVLNISISTRVSNNSTTAASEQSPPQQMTLTCQDGSIFSFPLQDVAQLPIVHASSEELAIYIWSQLLQHLTPSYLSVERGIHTLEITVTEAPGQEAKFSWPVPADEESARLDVASFVSQAAKPPAPCLVAPQVCCPDCIKVKAGTPQEIAQQAMLERLTKAMNQAGVQWNNGPLTCQDVEQFLNTE